MPHKIYVGNYPLSFIEDDVLNLFQDYEGVELVGFFKNKNKCYSFLHCMDKRQLLEIVVNLHDIDVCGRNLIVRAADENLHKQIQRSMLKYGAGNVHPKNTCDINNSTSSFENNETYSSSEARHSKQSVIPQAVNSESKNTFPKKYQMGTSACHSTMPNTYPNARRITKQNEDISNNYENHDYSPHFSESNYASRQNSHSTQTCSSVRDEGASSYCQNLSEPVREKSGPDFSPQETFSKISKSKTDASAHYKTFNERFDSYKTKSMHPRENASSIGHQTTDVREQYQSRNRNISESSSETVHDVPHSQQYEKLSCISVMNFPLRLPVRNLYELFADFHPLKIFIVCNEPRMDKTPTEAVICFENEKDATGAILTLDNTVYRGRILLVTDAVDKSIISELLSFKQEK